MTDEERQLLVVLLALLPKDGTPISVKQLATSAAVSQPTVTNVLFDSWFAKEIEFDVTTDSYFYKPNP